MRRIRFVIVLSAVFAIAVLGVGDRAEGSSPAPASVRLHEVTRILESVPLECTTNCEFSGCADGRHNNYEQAGGNDGGEEHSCAWSLNQCGDHNCNPDFASLGGLLQSLNAGELSALAAADSRVRFNFARSAIQVMGCNDLVLVSVNMSERQRTELTE